MSSSRNVSWYVKHFVHNVFAHPLLPLAELLKGASLHKTARLIYVFHDATTPEGDKRNKQRFT